MDNNNRIKVIMMDTKELTDYLTKLMITKTANHNISNPDNQYYPSNFRELGRTIKILAKQENKELYKENEKQINKIIPNLDLVYINVKIEDEVRKAWKLL